MNTLETISTKKKPNNESHTFTCDCIRTALFQLVKTTPYEKITVTAIIERAGVSRAGFYRNYISKEAVLEDIADSHFDKIFDTAFDDITQDNFKEKYTALFETISENKEYFDIISILSNYSPNIFDLSKYLKKEYIGKSNYEYYSHIAMMQSQRTVVLEWYKNGMKESPEEMADFFCKLYLS